MNSPPAKSGSALSPSGKARDLSLWNRLVNLFFNPWLQLALNTLIVTASELCLKLGARETAHIQYALSWTGVAGLASLWTWGGIAFVILSLLGWLYILRHIPLSV